MCSEHTRRIRARAHRNFDVSISTLFPANNSFRRIYSRVRHVTRGVKYAICRWARIERNRSILTKQKFMDFAEFRVPISHRPARYRTVVAPAATAGNSFASKLVEIGITRGLRARPTGFFFFFLSTDGGSGGSGGDRHPVQDATETRRFVKRMSDDKNEKEIKKKRKQVTNPARHVTYCRDARERENAPSSSSSSPAGGALVASSMTLSLLNAARDSDKRARHSRSRPRFERVRGSRGRNELNAPPPPSRLRRKKK